ncbi:DUF2637 domain-containing protein [Mycolicibacterium porcinum]|uniref:DUF2637 domain-containing protein n=1 Tax=Mycolicibacterium porcinum TaxID=39693 RepID=A0ABV3VN28_9MYCO
MTITVDNHRPAPAEPEPQPTPNPAPAGGQTQTTPGLFARLRVALRPDHSQPTPPAPLTPEQQRAARQLRLVKIARPSAFVINAVIMLASFAVSFNTQRDLAERLGWSHSLSWQFPVIIDGFIFLATLTLIAFAGYDSQKKDRFFVWGVLAFFSVISVSANVIHALLPDLIGQQGHVGLQGYLAAVLSCIPPLALLAATHILGMLWKFSPEELPIVSLATENAAPSLTDPQQDVAAEVAARLHAAGKCAGQSRDAIAAVIRILYSPSRSAMSLRQIGRQVDLGPDAVSRIEGHTEELFRGTLAA